MYGKTLAEIRFSQILVNECMVSGLPETVQEELAELRGLESENRRDEAEILLRKAVEKLSAGRNTVLYDAGGIPSVMVVVPMVTGEDMPEGIRLDGVHPAFRMGGKTLRKVYVSKYINTLVDGRAASLPMSQPACIPCFDAAVRSIRGKGAGWMPMPVQLRAAILLRCLKNGHAPSGNTDCGQDYYCRHEMGIEAENGTVLTGSGPAAWTHDGTQHGIWDLSGNLNEWDAGYRLVDGEIQLMELSAMMDADCDYREKSPHWYALDRAGKPVAPGTPDSLHFGGQDGQIRLTAQVPEKQIANCAFAEIRAEAGLQVPGLLKLIGLYPPADGLSERLGWRWINPEGETMPVSGGASRITYHSGMFFMGVTKPRDTDYSLAGVRTIYISPEDLQEVEQRGE